MGIKGRRTFALRHAVAVDDDRNSAREGLVGHVPYLPHRPGDWAYVEFARPLTEASVRFDLGIPRSVRGW